MNTVFLLFPHQLFKDIGLLKEARSISNPGEYAKKLWPLNNIYPAITC